MSPAPFARILRDPIQKDATLEISCSGFWKVFAGPHPEKIHYEKPMCTGKGSSRIPLPAEKNRRSYFSLHTEKETILLAEEHLPMAGGFNFRDLGGIRTSDGRHVAWGKLIRADEMNKLTAEDLAYLSSIPVLTVADFRTREEILLSSDRIPASVKNVHTLSIDPGRLDPDTLRRIEHAASMEEILFAMYRGMMRNDEVIAQYRKFFRLLQNDKNAPTLFHCTAGKDRTGMATVLILSALGVERPLILKNYLESNRHLELKYARLMRKRPQLIPLLTVKPEYLFLALEGIETDFLSVENFLEKALDVDIDHLRKNYLY